MMNNRVLWAAIVALVGALQAWDSGVLRSTALVQALVVLAILAAATTIASTGRYWVQLAAIAGAFVLLTAARALAPSPLPTLHLIAFVPAVIVLGSRVTRPASAG